MDDLDKLNDAMRAAGRPGLTPGCLDAIREAFDDAPVMSDDELRHIVRLLSRSSNWQTLQRQLRAA